MHERDGTASDTLDAIRRGGQQLVSIVLLRLVEVQEALSEGDFQTAYARLGEAQGAVTPLANAQGYMAIADGAELVRAHQMEAGMTIINLGTITEVEREDCDRHGDEVKVKLADEREMGFDPDMQLYVRREAFEPA